MINEHDIQSIESCIKESGNSDVDVNVQIQVDTKPIAFAILCSLLATKQMSNEEFELAILRLEKLTSEMNTPIEKFHSNENNDVANAQLYNYKWRRIKRK